MQKGSGQAESGQDIAAAPDGALYVTGGGNQDADGNMIPGGSDIYLARYDADGVHQWTEQWGSAASDVGRAITTDTNGDVYVAGISRDTIDTNSFAGSSDAFLTRWRFSP